MTNNYKQTTGPWYNSARFWLTFSLALFLLGGTVCVILLAIVHPTVAEGVVKNSSYSISQLLLSPDSTNPSQPSISITGQFNAGRDNGEIKFSEPVVFSDDGTDVGSVEFSTIYVQNKVGQINDEQKTLDILNSTALGVLVNKILTSTEVEFTGTSVVTVHIIGMDRAGIEMSAPFNIKGEIYFTQTKQMLNYLFIVLLYLVVSKQINIKAKNRSESSSSQLQFDFCITRGRQLSFFSGIGIDNKYKHHRFPYA
jgi:hypothetical protein